MSVSFDVIGTPMPQGSKRAFAVKGRAMMTEAGGLKHAAWRNAVADAAKAVAADAGCFDAPLYARLAFRFPMPKSRTKAQHAAGRIHKTTAPDIDKLQRAVFDGLQAAGLIRDDAQICSVNAYKHEVTGWTGVEVYLATAQHLTDPR